MWMYQKLSYLETWQYGSNVAIIKMATRSWNMWNIALQHINELLVLFSLSHVIIRSGITIFVKWLIMVYYTLTILRLLVEHCSCRSKWPKCPQVQVWLELTLGVSLFDCFKKSNLENLHGCALFTKVVANLSRNKSCFMTNSWKWLEHAQTWPTSHMSMLISNLANFLSPKVKYSFAYRCLKTCISLTKPNQLELQWKEL